MITKLLFLPFSIAAGLIGGLVGRRAFALAWGAVDDQEPPKPQDPRARLGKLALALALEGAVFRLAKGLVEEMIQEGPLRRDLVPREQVAEAGDGIPGGRE